MADYPDDSDFEYADNDPENDELIVYCIMGSRKLCPHGGIDMSVVYPAECDIYTT